MVTLQHRWGSVCAVSLRYPTIFLTFGIALAYIVLVVWLNQLSVVFPTMYAARPLYAYASAGLTLLIALMLGVNLTLFTHELHRRWMLRHSITATGGVIAGIIGAACPVCAVGLFPIFSGFFGSLFSLSTLPLYGLEFSILSVVLLGISLWTLTGIDLTCPLPPHGKKR